MVRILAAFVLASTMRSVVYAQDPVLDLALLGNAPKVGETTTLLKGPMPEFGLRAGYFKPRDADEGGWFGGVQVRVPLSDMFAIEGAVEVHAADFADGEIEVVQYPLQASLLAFLMPQTASLSPYGVAGVGWYYTVVDFSGSLSGLDGDTEHIFGGHLGFGARLTLGNSITASGDLRYIFLEPDGNRLEDEDFDTLQISLSLSFMF